MAASPGADALLSIGDMYSSPSPPSSPVLPPAPENSSLTTAAPPEPTQLDHATPTPPPPPGQDTAKHSELGESPQPVDCGELPPSLSPPEAAPSSPPALEAASLEKPASPTSCVLSAPVATSCPPGAPVQVFSDVSAPAASPAPSPQVGEAPPGDAPQLLSSPPPVTTSPHAVLDSSTTDVVAMASREAASPAPASDSGSHSEPALLTPPLGSGPEGLSLQKHLRPATPAMTLEVCENPETAQPSPLQAERSSTYMLLDAAVDDVAGVASIEAAGLAPALDGERDHLPAALECEAEGELSQQQPRLPNSEIVPLVCQNSEPEELPQLLPPSAESTYSSLEAVANDVAVVSLEEAAGPPLALDAMGGEAALESQSEGAPQEPMQTSLSPKMEAEAFSPDMAPPGFENFKSKWLPQPAHTLPVQSTHSFVEAPVTDTAGVIPEPAAGSLPTLETMDVKMAISAGQLPSSENTENRSLHHLVMGPSSLSVEAAPCSPDTPPPGFENFKASWLPQPAIPPSAETTYLPDVANTKEVLDEKSCSVPALDTTDMEIDTAKNLLPTLESGAGGLLEVPQPCSPSHKMQPAPCFSNIALPGFESLTLPQSQLPSSVAQTSHIVQDSVASGVVCLTSEDAPQPSPVLKAMDLEMDTVPALPPSSESEAQESMQQEQLQLPSFNGQGINCSLEIVPSRSENLVTLEDAVNTTVVVEAVSHPLSVPEVTEGAKGHILSPQLESGCDGPFPCLEPKASSPAVQAATFSPEIMTTCFKSLKFSQETSPCGAERIDFPSNLPFTNSVTLKSEKPTQPSPLHATDKDMESAEMLQSPLKSKQKSLPHPRHQASSPSGKDAPSSPVTAPPGYENLESSEELPPPLPLCTKSVPLKSEEMAEPCSLHAIDTDMESAQVLQSTLKSEQKSLPHPQHQPCSPTGKDAPSSSPDAPPPGYENWVSSEELPPPPPLCTNSMTLKFEKTTQPSPLRSTDTDMESAQVLQSPLKSEEKSLPHPQHQPSSSSGKDAPSSPDTAPPGYEYMDSSEELPPPPPVCTNFEMGQMVCGRCRELIAYPRGATYVQCFGCWTINFVLEAQEVGNVYCGQCETLLMYPFGAPAVRCSNCLFVTEIGERNVRQRMSTEPETPPHYPQEVAPA